MHAAGADRRRPTSAAGRWGRRSLLTPARYYRLGVVGVGRRLPLCQPRRAHRLEPFVDARRVPVKVLDLRAGWKQGPVELPAPGGERAHYIYNLVPQTLAPVRTVTLTAVWSH